MHHPWQRFRALTQWRLDFTSLPGNLLGTTNHATKTVTLDRRLLQAERRCTIAHELEHIARGPTPTDPILAAREEETIDRIVARKLITIRALGEALAWTTSTEEAADELWVDVPTLKARLRSLHPSERAYLKKRLEHHDHH